MKRYAFLLFLFPMAAWSTVTTPTFTVSYTCTGSTGPYAFSFPISDASAMTVTQSGSVLSPTSYTMKPVNNKYSNGGSVTLNAPCMSGTVVLTRNTPLTQTSHFNENQPVPMSSFENGLDKLTQITQEIDSDVGTKGAAGTCPSTQFMTGLTTTTIHCAVGGGVGPPGAPGAPGAPGPPGAPGAPGTGNITPSPQFTVMYQPTPGTQANAQGDTAITTDGAGSLQAKVGFGTRIASQWGDKSTNGIATAVASNQLVVADPSYPTTEVPTWATLTSNQSHIQDLRQGSTTNVYRNSYASLFNFGVYPFSGPLSSAESTYCQYDGSTTAHPYCRTLGMHDFSPGYNYGNSPGVTVTNWATNTNASIVTESRNAGISSSLSIFHYKTGVGDNFPAYFTGVGYGGSTGGTDESNKGVGINMSEGTDGYSGTCSTGCTNGSQSVLLSVANGSQGVGRYLYNSTAPPTVTGNITAMAASTLNVGMASITIDAGVPVSNGWGKLVAAVNTPVNAIPPFTTSETITMNTLGGAGFNDFSLVCFQGTFHEQAYPVPGSVSTVAGVTTMTLLLRRPHAANTSVMQGGMCGMGLEIPAYTFSGQKYLFDIVGSTAANNLQVEFFYKGNQQIINIATSFGIAQTILGYQTLATTTAAYGTTVYLNVTVPQTIQLYQYNGSSISISGLTDSITGAWGGTCTNTQWTDISHGTCTLAGLTGTHGTTTQGLMTLGLSAFNAYAIAEVTDVRNNAVNPPTVDGSFLLEPNVIPISVGNTLKELNHYSSQWASFTANNIAANPFALSSQGAIITYSGRGAQGGSPSVLGNAILYLGGPSSTQFTGGGGYQAAPNGIALNSSYTNGIITSGVPTGGNNFISIAQGSGASFTNPSYSANFMLWATRVGNWTRALNPYFGDVTETIPRINTIGGSVVTFTSPTFGAGTYVQPLSFGLLTTPVVTVIPKTSGGTLPDGSYCYKVQARDAGAIYTSAQSIEYCQTITGGGGNGSVQLSWTPSAGASGYYVFGRTTGLTGQILTVNGIANTLYTDTGVPSSITPSSAYATNVPGITNTGFAAFNSIGSAFQTTVRGTSGLAANNAVSLPTSAGTLVDDTDLNSLSLTYVGAGSQLVAGSTPTKVFVGDFNNLLANSTNMTLAPWAPISASFVVTGGQADPFTPPGTTAVKLVTNPLTTNAEFSSGWNPTALTTYCMTSWMKGAVGGEPVNMGMGYVNSGDILLTTSWVRYSWTAHTVAGVLGTQIAQWILFGTGLNYTIYVAGPQVNLGPCPGAFMPVYVPTTASPSTITGIITPTLSVTGTTYGPGEFDNGTCTTAKTIDPANGNEQLVTLTNAQTCALTFVAPASTVTISLRIKQSTSGGFNGLISAAGVLWPSGATPVITATSGAEDWITCKYRGTAYRCVPSQDFR